MSLETLRAAIDDLKNAPKVDIKGKMYSQVATRVEVFRKHFGPDFGIETNLLSVQDNFVRVQAKITHNGNVVASGLAEENRSNGAVNRTSAIENCETSAIGRALAAFGLHGGEYATAEEVSHAIRQQEKSNGDFVKTNLKARAHEMVRELHACTDMDMLTAYWTQANVKETLLRMKSHYPEGFQAVNEAKDRMKGELTPTENRLGDNTVLGAA